MKARAENSYQPTGDLYVGEFYSDSFYVNWRPRGSGDWLLIYTAGGAGYLTTRSGAGPTQVGEATLYAPNDEQDYKTDPVTGRWHLLWVHFKPKPAWHPWLHWPPGLHGVKSLHLEQGEVRDHFVGAMKRMLHIFPRKLPNAMDFAFNALEEALLWAHVTASRGTWMRTDMRVRKAMDYLAANLRQPFRLEILARHCGLSVSRLAHLFKIELGLSPQRIFRATASLACQPVVAPDRSWYRGGRL